MSDIKSIERGILPMRRNTNQGPLLYGSEIIHRSSCGRYIEVMSTKYTTFLSQGRRVCKLLP
jgi:hypothetical protein